MPLNSPVRLIPAVGVTTGAHYRTLLMFFMFQNIIPAPHPYYTEKGKKCAYFLHFFSKKKMRPAFLQIASL